MARIVITGANRGIGLALARAYVERGDKVVAAVRTTTDDLDGLGVEVHEGVDVTDDAAVQHFANSLAGGSVDVLINNAGIATPKRSTTSTGTASGGSSRSTRSDRCALTRALLPRLGEGSKVAIVTSRSGSIGDNGSGGTYGYRMSKAAVNMARRRPRHRPQAEGDLRAAAPSGMVRTDMGGGPGAVEPEDAAARMVARIDEIVGGDHRQVPPLPRATNCPGRSRALDQACRRPSCS